MKLTLEIDPLTLVTVIITVAFVFSNRSNSKKLDEFVKFIIERLNK